MILLITCDVSMGLQLGTIDSDVSGTVGAPGHPYPHIPSRRRGSRGLSLCLPSPRTDLPAPYTLQEVQVAVINNSMCNHLYQKPDFRVNIWGDMVCAGSPAGGKDSCFVSITSPPHGLLGAVPYHS